MYNKKVIAAKVFLFISHGPFTYVFTLYVYYNLWNSLYITRLRQVFADGGAESYMLVSFKTKYISGSSAE